MSELRELYQEVILDHNRRPRNHRKLAAGCREAKGYNPLCGDKLTLYLELDGDVIKDVGFEGSGCAISTASASLMTEALKGRTRAEVEKLFATFHDLMTGSDDSSIDKSALGKLEVLTGVREFPVRIKCATLAWHTMRSALDDDQHVTTTE